MYILVRMGAHDYLVINKLGECSLIILPHNTVLCQVSDILRPVMNNSDEEDTSYNLVDFSPIYQFMCKIYTAHYSECNLL